MREGWKRRMIPVSPIRHAELPDGWIDDRRTVIRREGFAIRPHAALPRIEIKSLRTNEWLAVGLPGNAPGFASAQDRDLVLAALSRA